MENSQSSFTTVSSLRDNHARGTVGEFLQSGITPGSSLSFVSAYFTIFAYYQLKDRLDQIKDLKFLFGEPAFLKNLDPTKVNKRDFKIEDDKLVIPEESILEQKLAAKACAEWIKNKVQVKSMVKPNFLHGKLYHILQENGVEKAVIGSSNFTTRGLGLAKKNNLELNLIVADDRDRTDLKNWFDELWNDTTGLVEDVRDQVLKYLEQLYVENEPEFIYYKTLFHIFENYLTEQKKGGLLNEKTGFYESDIWGMLYDFQKDGVRGAINKILKHNGCIIADSVGLGKTFEALAVIKYFELQNNRVLVLCPKKLSDNWTIYQASQNNSLNPLMKDRFNYHVLFHTDMGRLTGKSSANALDLQNFNWGAYDLVVIDESHNFRGNPIEKTGDDGEVKKNRALWLMDHIIKQGSKTKVLLLSATPVNTNLRDLRNQISIITEGDPNALFETTGIKDYYATLKNAQTQFTNWADPKKTAERNTNKLLDKLDPAFFKLLDELTIARSRKHIKSGYDLEKIGEFPKRLKPVSIYPEIDLQKNFPSYDRINRDIMDYKLSLFNPSRFVRAEFRYLYEDSTKRKVMAFSQAGRENTLINMMKINFLKRLESSVESFEITMQRTVDKINRLLLKIENFKHRNSLFAEDDLEEVLSGFENEEFEDEEFDDEIGSKLKFKLEHLDLDSFITALKIDKDNILSLLNSAKAVTPERDEKLARLKLIIMEKLKAPINPENNKVLIFTAFADTAQYLFANLSEWCRKELRLNIALVAGSYTKTSFGSNDFSSILTNFSPVSKNRNKMAGMPQNGEIDLLIATDCISEGQNLQDCDFLINYDIHWNPVRIIQRFGRIDRLGSKNKTIKMVNFWPTKDLDNYIVLKSRVEARMAIVDLTATADDNLFDHKIDAHLESRGDDNTEIQKTDDKPEKLGDDNYRLKQLLKLKDEILDLEDIDDGVSLTDFTLDDFRIDLVNFLDKNREKLQNAPLGLYSVVPSPSEANGHLLKINNYSPVEREIIKPGVIFCFKQTDDTIGNETVNPLNPYYLLYMREDGTIRYNFTSSKQILEIFRTLCQGVQNPWVSLCDLFNEETDNGKKMDKYTSLMKKAAQDVASKVKQKSMGNLISGRSGIVIPQEKQVRNLDNLELITWLVIK